MKQAIIGSHVVQKVMPAPVLEKRFFFLAAEKGNQNVLQNVAEISCKSPKMLRKFKSFL